MGFITFGGVVGGSLVGAGAASADPWSALTADGEVRHPDNPLAGQVMPGVPVGGTTVQHSDGNAAALPSITGERGVICSHGQNNLSTIIECS